MAGRRRFRERHIPANRAMSLKAEKNRLRAAMRERLRAMTPGQWADASLAVVLRVRSMDAWRRARCIGAYVPMVREPDVTPLVNEATAMGKVVAMPGWDAASGTYRFMVVRDMSRDMLDGPHGARVPAPGLPPMDAALLDFVMVPGIAFDSIGGRLGRGMGFYDRLLAGCAGVTCGVCANEQVVERVPMEAHDVRLACIVFPGGIHGESEAAGARGSGSGTSD